MPSGCPTVWAVGEKVRVELEWCERIQGVRLEGLEC